MNALRMPQYPTLERAAQYLSRVTTDDWDTDAVLDCAARGELKIYGRADRDCEILLTLDTDYRPAVERIMEGHLYPLQTYVAVGVMNAGKGYLLEVPSDDGRVWRVVDEGMAPIITTDAVRVNLKSLEELAEKIAPAVEVDVSHAPVARTQVNSTKGKKSDVLTPVIEDAVKECQSDDPARVWALLEEHAGEQRRPFVGVVINKGLKYRNNGKDELLSRGALAGRLRRRKPRSVANAR